MSASRSDDYNALGAVIAAARETGDHFGKAIVGWLRGHVRF
ncbi:MAG: helix-turn-helix transcriptional regulator, partial [Mesorhizobium sp.]